MGYYYNITDDLKDYPDCWCYIIVGGRNTGKTYSALWHTVKENESFTFLKRTKEDVELLCSGNGTIGTNKKSYGIDMSPFKSINRDKHTNIHAFTVNAKAGIGGFWETNSEGEPEGLPKGYIIPLSCVQKVKGFDLSDCSYLIFDEFIPQPWERVSRKEGEQVMDVYKTISRDREHRELPPLKLIALANATSISNPLMNILEITDIVAEMNTKKIPYTYIEERGIFIRVLNDNKEFQEKEKQSIVYKAMGNTAWGRMAFENEFAYNDFTKVGHINMKGFSPKTAFTYKHKNYYIYGKDGTYYITSSKAKVAKIYDLNVESEQKAFYLDWVIDLRNRCIEGKMLFEKYTIYDIVMNYKKIFQI